MHTRTHTLLAAALVLLCSASEQGSAQYSIPRGVFGCAAVSLQAAGNRVAGTLGQCAIGVEQGAANRSLLGFWYTLHRNTTGAERLADHPDLVLGQNYPNPFQSSTSIPYIVPARGNVALRVFDIYGREVKTLVRDTQPAGSYRVDFDPRGLPAGLYVCRLECDGLVLSRSMTRVP